MNDLENVANKELTIHCTEVADEILADIDMERRLGQKRYVLNPVEVVGFIRSDAMDITPYIIVGPAPYKQ